MMNDNTKPGFIYCDRRIPYSIINEESETPMYVQEKFKRVFEYYDIYRKGAEFTTEGTNADYIASDLKHKMCARLINKEARFMFAETPDIKVESSNSVEPNEVIAEFIDNTQAYVDKVLEVNDFDKQLLQAAKDCFIGGRIACMLNFNVESGVTITFLKSTEFIAEYKEDQPNILKKFVSFQIIKESDNLSEVRIFKKKYILKPSRNNEGEIQDICYAEDSIYDGTGNLLEVTYPLKATEFDKIPAAVFVNDGLIGDEYGESEIENLKGYESQYSKLANADVDTERKTMNAPRYTIDMEPNSTKGLSTSPGAYWDLTSDQNLESSSPQIGTLENTMSYSTPLDTTLRRIKSSMYDQVDIPDISLENMSGVITSGKALKSVYWPLIVRCKEKMKTWGPKIRYLISCIIDGATYYPQTIKRYTSQSIVPFEYTVKIEINYPLPEDEQDEKNMDLQEVMQQTMSKKSYMKKWRLLSDDKANEELKQIALEKQLFEDSGFSEDDFANM